jgi:hypothetical protein
MKGFVLGSLTGSAITLALLYSVAYAVGPLPVLFTAHLIGHDAAGRTFNATAHGNSLNYSGATTSGATVLTLEFTTDQLLCSGFGN